MSEEGDGGSPVHGTGKWGTPVSHGENCHRLIITVSTVFSKFRGAWGCFEAFRGNLKLCADG